MGPSNVVVVPTSGTMITVSWGPPEFDGGDPITAYRVEWDTFSSFYGVIPIPNKGSVDLDAAAYSSYTIQHLTQGQKYYIRVSAINSAGSGTPTLSTPISIAPGLQIPGRPHNIKALTGLQPGEIIVSWQTPFIPWHNIPCYGLPTAPQLCPTAVGGLIPLANGGTDIVQYVVSYNENEDFSGLDTGEQTTSNTLYTLNGLTAGRIYYIRVLARNAQGAGAFCLISEPYCLKGHTPIVAVAKAVVV